MTPTLSLLDLLDAAQHNPALTSLYGVVEQHVLLDADQRGLIELLIQGGATVSAYWAIHQASNQQRLHTTVVLTDAGRDYLAAA